MNSRKDILVAVLTAAFAAGASGCEMMHELQPHRLWKLNHGSSGMPPEDYSYHSVDPADSNAYLASVPDDPPARPPATDAGR
jgi:hypothetical protein